MTDNYYKKLSAERKALQEAGELPDWYTTAGYQLFKDKYQWADTPRKQYAHIATTLARHLPESIREEYADRFFQLLWKGWLSPSTPVLANTGTERGLPVSCSGGYVPDSIEGFYTARTEAALLTKYGFGTSGYLGDIRPRGAEISRGGKASGVLPVIKGFVQDSRDVSQGGVRRGSYAAYLPIDHGDFDELARYMVSEPDDLNVGWNVSNSFVSKLDEGDAEARRRFATALKTKLVTGKGYFFFPDKANKKLPPWYPLPVKASNLCSEIVLPSDEEHTFTCVLSSMNVAKFDEWKGTHAIYEATVFLDCVASEFIDKARGIKGLENAVRFTEKARALGLGVAGFHTYLQQKRIAVSSLEAVYFNQELFEMLDKESFRASVTLGSMLGLPEWVEQRRDVVDGPYPRNCSRIAVAPTKSTALIMGGISEGINVDPGYVYTQSTAGGEVLRISPVFLELMKERGQYSTEAVKSINDKAGSVQHLEWLTDHEREVFKTAFEIDQSVLVRLAAQRGAYIDQWQSLNLFFSAEADPAYVARVHKEAFLHPAILGMYYIYSKSGVNASTGGECAVCQ